MNRWPSLPVLFETHLNCHGGFPHLEIPDRPLGDCRKHFDTVQMIESFSCSGCSQPTMVNAARGNTKSQGAEVTLGQAPG